MEQSVNVTRLIDECPLGALQVRVLVLCGLVALLDGMDLQAIGLAAPSIARMLHVEPRAFGAVFSAALLGLMLGAFTLGPMADRFGRKRILVASTLTFGIFSICTALVSSFTALLVVRFLTGLGLGGAMPSFISLASEYTPRRIRALMVTVLWAGFPLGGMIGGVLASLLIPTVGWQSIFYVGGIAPLVLACALAVGLPESVGFLVARGAPTDVIRGIVRKISPRAADAQGFVFGEERLPGLPVRHLFTGGRATGTLLLWVPYFTAFLMLVTNSAWSPTLLNAAGLGGGQPGIIMAAFNGGSVVGTLIVGWLISVSGPYRVLAVVLALSALAFGSIGFAVPSFGLVTLLEGLGGVFLGAGSSGLIALAAVFYPTVIRSSGVGWATGVGRFGSFVGPLVAAILVGWHWDVESLYIALGVPGVCAALFVLLLGLDQTRRPGGSAASS
ncbi:MAG: transporter, family, 4-hydroxybenzoate transporter [Rhodopila sp.]|jgi:AAHS family 4-hydroxybenzoate transporter-like MFS transporter|nr:transporter, family, 4-hydroxybenzoate transporter [Rhodopila sp.]